MTKKKQKLSKEELRLIQDFHSSNLMYLNHLKVMIEHSKQAAIQQVGINHILREAVKKIFECEH